MINKITNTQQNTYKTNNNKSNVSFGTTTEISLLSKQIVDIRHQDREFKYLGNLATRILRGDFHLKPIKKPEQEDCILLANESGDMLKYKPNGSLTLYSRDSFDPQNGKKCVTTPDQMSETTRCLYDLIIEKLPLI